MRKQRLSVWVAANALGLGLAFVVLMDPSAPFIHGLDFDNYWQPVPPGSNWSELVGAIVAFVAGGLVFGSAQALALRPRPVSAGQWILATTVGFVVLAITVVLPLQAAGILGRIPGPVEPIITTVGGCSVAGLMQYLAMRRRGIVATRWLVLWVVGLVLSIVPTALLFLSLARLGLPVNWPTEIFLNGLVCAGFAAWISGGCLLTAVPRERTRRPSFEARTV